MKLLSKLEKKKDTWFLIAVAFFFTLIRIPSIFEPLWYGDEGVYETVGMGLNQGRLLYRDIWDNKPPLLYIVYALFHSNQPLIRVVNLSAGLLSVIFFFFIVKKIFTSTYIRYVTTSVFALLLGIPFLEGNIANAENFMMPFVLAAGLLILYITEKTTSHHRFVKFTLSYFIQNTKYNLLLFAGFLLGIAFLFKVVAVFDFAAFAVFLIVSNVQNITKKTTRAVFFEMIPFFAGFFLPLVCTIGYFAAQHALFSFVRSAFLTNIGYVNYANQFIIPQGLLIIKLILLAGCCLILFVKRRHLSKPTMFVASWFSFSLFNALFSQRPYTHYLLVLLASFCLLLGFIFKKNKAQLFSLAIILIAVIYLGTHFSFFKKNLAYYQNFFSFITGTNDIQSYRSFFDRSTPRDYALSDFLLTQLHSHDTIFLWGNNAQLYPLTHTLPPGRYTVAYHITMDQQSLIETAQAISRVNPRFIVIMPNAGNFPYRLTNYAEAVTIGQATIYERSN